MEFWDSLFLNEGFATKTEYVGTDHYAPQFQIMRQFQSGDILVAMEATQ
jgi:aminopeptidase N